MFGDFIPYTNGILNHSAQNSKIIANNISNFNTPGFKTQALQFENVVRSEMSKGMTLSTNNERHITNKLAPMQLPASETVQESGGKARFDGNNVDQTAEMIKMLKNNYVHGTSVNAINKEFGLFRTAIGR